MSRFGWAETQDGMEWDDFVTKTHGSIFHLWAWRKVLESDGSKPLYLACRDEKGRILAVCPFFYRSGRRLLYLDSLPDSNAAGPIIDNQVSDVREIIVSLRKSVRFTPFNPVAAMRIRTIRREVIEPMLGSGFKYEVMHGLLTIDLQEETPEEIWSHGFEKHDRQAVKYYEQNGKGFGLSSEEDDYRNYLALQRGSTTHSEDLAAFVSKLRQNLGDDLKVASVALGNEVVAGVLMLCDRPSSAIHLSIMRFSPTKNIHSAVTYLNWGAANWARKNGFRYVDLGSYPVEATSGPGHHFYKLRMRFKAALVLRYHFILPTSTLSYSIVKRISRVF
jgi:hypothetical protein